VVATAADGSATGRWRALPADERELFFSAIARHRRASWRVTAACAVATSLLAVVVAILMAPLLYCLAGLALDVLNLFQPVPDLLTAIGRRIDTAMSSDAVPASTLIQLGVTLALPGFLLMGVLAAALRRVWVASPLFNAGDLGGRPPDRTVLAEQQLANVVEEMAIAAGAAAVPRIVIVPGGVNAAACGRDDTHVTILVGEALPGRVSREHLEGLMAHLIASIVDGDMAIGMRVTTTLTLFGLLARIGTSFTDRNTIVYVFRLWRAVLAPTSPNTLTLLSALTDPFAAAPRPTRPATSDQSGLTWRDWAIMPLMGPVVLSGFLSGVVCQFFLEPLVVWAWRERKYMADATAVQLTRNPDALAGGLAAIEHSYTSVPMWAAHLAVAAQHSGAGGPFGTSFVPIFPSIEKRVRALNRMGAHTALQPKAPMPRWLVILISVAAVVVGGLMSVVVVLLVWVSTAISGLFTIFPAAILHFLLRWLRP
jgi:Zn-dependent protease with chaperone function